MSRAQNIVFPLEQDVLASVAKAVKGLAYGEVHIVVHESRIVRIERIERIRVGNGGESSGGAGRKGGDD